MKSIGSGAPPPSWLMQKVDQRVAELKRLGAFDMSKAIRADITMIYLVEPPEDPELIKISEFTCDNCGAIKIDDKQNFFGGTLVDEFYGLKIMVGWGACRKCRFMP